MILREKIMRIVSFTDVLEAKYGIREAIRMNKEAGFEGLDYYDMSERACGRISRI